MALLWRVKLDSNNKTYYIEADNCDDAIEKALKRAGLKRRCGSTCQVVEKNSLIYPYNN